MVVNEVLGIIAPIAAAINLTCLIVWLRQRRRRVVSVHMPVFQPMAEDYLSDIYDSVRAIEEALTGKMGVK